MNDYQKIQLVWEYILSLNFESEVFMERSDEGYEIIINCDNNK